MSKRLLTVVLSTLLIFSFVLSDINSISVSAAKSANSRQKAYIDFASSRATVTEEGLESLTKDEMRILGVFLSNFYVPWGTQLVETDDDDKSREQMVSVLTDSLKFDKTLASDIVDATFQMSVDSATKLDLTAEFKLDGTEMNYTFGDFSYIDLLTLLADDEYTIALSDRLDEDGNPVTCRVSRFYLTCNGKKVFDLGYNTASGISIRQCLRNLPMEKGIGYNLVSVTKDMEGQSYTSDGFDSILSTVSTVDDLYYISAYGWNLYVDCFGNIIVDCGTGRQYILVPACMNPYAWKKDGCSVGDCLPMNNLAWFSESATGSLTYANDAEGGTSSIKFNFENRGTSANPNSSLTAMRIVRGSNAYEFTSFGDRFRSLIGYSSSASDSMLGIFEVYNKQGHPYSWASKMSKSLLKPIWMKDRVDFINIDVEDILDGCSLDESKTIQDFIMFDTLGAFSGENETMTINAYGIFADENHSPLGGGISDKFKNYLYDANNNTLVQMNAEEQKKYIAGIYCAYVFAYFETQGTELGGHVNFRFCPDNLPEIGSGNIELTDNSLSEMQSKVLSMAYLLLHPTEGTSYVNKLVKTKAEGVLLDWHSDLVGNTSTGSTTGATKYVGTSSYMTTPEINDVSWLNSLFCLYTNNVVYVLFIVLLFMLLYAISGYMSWQRALMNAVCFGACIYFVPVLISSAISLSNRVTDGFYNNKFTYWGIVQHEAYAEDLNSAIEEDNYSDYMVTLFNQQGFQYDSHAVNLKWMCPKKDNFLVNIQRELTESTNSSSLTKLLNGVLNSQVSGEDYTRSANKTYLYRSYTDIASYAKYIYENIGGRGTGKLVNDLSPLEEIIGYNDVSLGSYFRGYLLSRDTVTSNITDGSLDLSESLGFNYNTGLAEDSNSHFYYFNRSNKLASAVNRDLKYVGSSLEELGVPTSSFNFTVANFNSSDLMSTEGASLGVYSLYSESPFYYLNWNLRDQLSVASAVSSYPVKDLLLAQDGDVNSYFYNTAYAVVDTDSYGQLRDYMDMRSLFTVVIPYLKECNDAVIAFDETYDLKMIGDYKISYTTLEDGTMKLDVPSGLNTLTEENKDEYYSFWHDVQVSSMFNMYTPWVDTLYSCSYSKPERVSVAGKSYTITDPLNPATYPEGRPMIFSESERLYYGLSYGDLTSVEKKILNINQSCYEKLPMIMNYYTFDKDVLVTAISMIETFEFNKEFSEVNFIGESNVLYPQGFELKNFSFDAYFRLVLSATTGIDLNSSKSIYSDVVEDTSVLTGILIILVDLSAVWAVPIARIVLVVLLFLLSIFTVLYCCLVGKQGENLDFRHIITSIGKSVVSPLVKYLLVTVLCAFIVSLMLSSGYTGITGSLDYTISFEDPVVAMFVLLGINTALVVFYVKLIMGMFKDFKGKAKGIGASVLSVGAGLTALCTGAISGKSQDVSDVGVPASSSGASSKLAPKLPSRKSASEKLAKKELAEKRRASVDSAKHKAGSAASAVGRTMTAPIRNAHAKKAAQAEAEAQQRREAAEAEEKRRAEILARQRKDDDMVRQAQMNAKALLDEQEKREAQKKQQQELEKQKAAEKRRNDIDKGLQEVNRKKQANANKPAGNNRKPKANSQKPKKGKGGKKK